jgi:hypothetical protein
MANRSSFAHGAPRTAWTIAMVLALSACSRPGEDAYRASVACVANEYVVHDLLDQNYDARSMAPPERSRFETFTASALREGQALGRSVAEVQRDVSEKIAASRAEYRKFDANIQATRTVFASDACQKRIGVAAGKLALRFGSPPSER